jgi:hypothetical protein
MLDRPLRGVGNALKNQSSRGPQLDHCHRTRFDQSGLPAHPQGAAQNGAEASQLHRRASIWGNRSPGDWMGR